MWNHFKLDYTMKKLFFVSALLALTAALKAQNYQIDVFEAYKNQNPETSGSIWQSLTSEVYLMNMSSMDKLIDEIYFRNKKKRMRGSVSSVFITAKFDGTAVFNGIEYPLYRFKSAKDGKFSDIKNNNSSLRIIEAMPVSSVFGDKTEEIVSMQLELHNSPDIVSAFAAKQLKTLSSNMTAASVPAMKAYVKEISALLSQNLENSASVYSFSTPVNISAEENAGEKSVNSIAVYFFKPELSDDDLTLGGQVKENLDSLLKNNVQNINPGHLNTLMGYQNYPYIVCVNYKTKYSVNINKDLTADKLALRKNSLNEAFSQGRINADIYNMGTELNNFLNLYVDIKKNAKNNAGHFYILKDYRELRNMYSRTKKIHDGDKVFEECFNNVYRGYIKDIEDNFLTDGMEDIKTAADLLQNGAKEGLKQEEYEKDLTLLKAVTLPDTSDDEVLKMKDLISRTETLLYNSFYAPMISEFEKAPSFYECQRLISYMERTKCEKCYLAIKKAVEGFKNTVNENKDLGNWGSDK